MNQVWNIILESLTETLTNIARFLPHLAVALLLFGMFAVVAGMSKRITRRTLEKFDGMHWTIRQLIVRVVYVSMLLVGAITALGAVDINVSSLITSLGVAGFALGFALKDIIENFISGTLLLMGRPFEIGDQVVLGKDFEGVVTAIQLRTTTLHTFSNDLVAIPNTSVYSNAIINHTQMGTRRYSVEFATSVLADSDEVQKRALAVAENIEGIKPEPPPSVRLLKLDSVADTLLWRLAFTASPVKAEEVRITSKVLQGLQASIFEAGIPAPSAGNIKPFEPIPAAEPASERAAEAAKPAEPAGPAEADPKR